MKKLIFKLLHSLGITLFAAWWNRKRVVFICYHGVTESDARSPHNQKGLHVNRHRFLTHLAYLKRRHHVISLRDYLEAREQRRTLPNYSVVLTFDDGFRNFLTVAAPCLAASAMPATVFIITNNTNETNSPSENHQWSINDDFSYLSWAEIRALKRDGNIEFGSHTCSHSRLLTLPLEEWEHELRTSYQVLATQLETRDLALSYPKGEHSEIISDYARKLGYSCAVTTDRGANELDHDLFTLGRTLIGDFDDEPSFAVRVSGLRWWLVYWWSKLAWLRFSKRLMATASRPEVEAIESLPKQS